MAKQPNFKKLGFDIKVSQAALKADRMGDYRFTNNVLKSLYSNLGSTQAGLGRKLTAQQDRELDRLAKYQTNTQNRTSAITQRARTVAGDRFGSAVAGGISYSALDSMGKAGIKAVRGQIQAGVQRAGGNTAALGIAAQGAAAAQAGAEYMTGQALLARTQEDATTIAAERADLAKLRLQHELEMEQMKYAAQLEMQTFKKEQRILKRVEDEEGKTGLTQYTTNYTSASAEMRRYLAENPGTTSTELYTWYVGQFNVPPGTESAIGLIANAVHGSVGADGQTVEGYSRADEAAELANMLGAMYGLSPKGTDKLESTIRAQLDATYSAWAVDAAEGGAGAASDSASPSGETLTYEPFGGGRAVTVDPQTGYVVPEVTGEGTPATADQPGVTRSGKPYVIRYGKPWYQDTGYAVPDSDMPKGA